MQIDCWLFCLLEHFVTVFYCCFRFPKIGGILLEFVFTLSMLKFVFVLLLGGIFRKVLHFLEFAFVLCVECDTRRVESLLHSSITPVHCWDTFGSILNSSALPYGLYFVNNTLTGELYYSQELKPYKIVSSHDVKNPYILYIGSMDYGWL